MSSNNTENPGEAAKQPSEVLRYVAIGDSQTEGLNDYDEVGQPRGWADRFAESLSARHPDLLYANLAVRGKRTAEIRREQLAPAVALAPDLATVVSGVNDVVRSSVDVDAVAGEIEAMYGALASIGCRVMGCTFPLPTVGLIRRAVPRLRSLNAAIRVAAARHGVVLVELEGIAMASDPRLWSEDRIHLNADGHGRLASAFEATLTGEGDRRWTEPLPPAALRSRVGLIVDETAWITRFVVPKIFRMIRGQSSGDGRSAKRPELRPLPRP